MNMIDRKSMNKDSFEIQDNPNALNPVQQQQNQTNNKYDILIYEHNEFATLLIQILQRIQGK